MKTYRGSCHCGALRFRFQSEEITSGLRCNCSVCARKGTVMSKAYVPPERFESMEGLEGLAVYRWGDKMVNMYFCKTCGIHVFHDTTLKPGHYRLNLGCLEDFDPLAIPYELVDGKSF